MSIRRKKYRAYAVGLSLLVHVAVFVVAGVLWIQVPAGKPEYVSVDIVHRRDPVQVAPRVERKQRAAPKRTRSSTTAQKNPVPATPLPAETPSVSQNPPAAISETEFIERIFFGDSLYAILQEYPSLRPLALQQILTKGVPTKDSLETLRQQLAQALLPYINMSEPERQARANMKLFGTPTNPMRPGPIPGNIPISDIIMLLIQLLK